MRACLGPSSQGCPNGALVKAGVKRCPSCSTEFERTRGTASQRGYGKTHRDIRAEYQAHLDAGQTYTCWRCPRTINPRAWHLGHCDDDRGSYHGPECVACNTATSAHQIGCPHPSHN